ncbi:MAG: alpha/beta hydrolase [Alphaproteobacteria bacterium]
MRPEDYPPQEPFSGIGAVYHDEVLRFSEGVEGFDVPIGDDPYQSLAVYPATTPNGDVLCLIHGGGWTNGYKEWMAFMAPALNARGITAVSFGYRLAPANVHPAQFEDCAAAVAWVYRNIARHGGNPDRIFVGGHSAGGHLSSLLALRTDWQAPLDLPDDIVTGALPISGTYLFGEGSGLSMRPRFLGDEALGNEGPASPMSHLRSGAPPFLVAYGSQDFPHLIEQARQFSQKLTNLGVSVSEIVLEGCDHLGASYASGEMDGLWINSVEAFLAESRNEPGSTA